MTEHERPVLNTDREIWRERPDDYYSPSIHVTEGSGIGINLGGTVIVLPLKTWFELAKEYNDKRPCPSCGSMIKSVYRRGCDTENATAHPWHTSPSSVPAEGSARKATPADIQRGRELAKQYGWLAETTPSAERECLRKLVAKLKLILPKIDAMCAMEAIHGRPYQGPTIGEELAEAERVLGEGKE